MDISSTYHFLVTVSRSLSTLAVGALLGKACANELVHHPADHVRFVLTKDVEVLNEMELGAGLVRGTQDVLQSTTSEKASQDAIRLNGRLVQATSVNATTLLLVVLLGTRITSSDTQSEGKGSNNGGEAHGDFGKVKLE